MVAAQAVIGRGMKKNIGLDDNEDKIMCLLLAAFGPVMVAFIVVFVAIGLPACWLLGKIAKYLP